MLGLIPNASPWHGLWHWLMEDTTPARGALASAHAIRIPYSCLGACHGSILTFSRDPTSPVASVRSFIDVHKRTVSAQSVHVQASWKFPRKLGRSVVTCLLFSDLRKISQRFDTREGAKGSSRGVQIIFICVIDDENTGVWMERPDKERERRVGTMPQWSHDPRPARAPDGITECIH